MKLITLFTLSYFCLLTTDFSQTYSFSKLVKKAIVQTANGNQQRVLSTSQGPFRFVFETPNDPQIKKLFTLLEPGQSNAPGLPYYALLKEMGYAEKDGKLLKKSLYYFTGSNDKVLVMIGDDYSTIVITNNDDTIWEYIK